MNKHLKQHLMFYIGLITVVVGWAATADFQHLTLAGAALAANGLLTLVGKYVQQNLPDDPQDPLVKPALPPAQEK